VGGVDFLNIEYLLVRAYELLASFNLNADNVVHGFSAFVQGIFIVGMVLTLLLLCMIVYAQIRLLQVEHEGFHGKEAHAHEQHEPEVVSTPAKNDRWERIVELSISPSEGDWRRAILEADIMLGDALEQAGYQGSSVGEQLKMANPIQVTNLDLAWKAHKVRNEVAHGGEGYALTERDLRVAIDYYKRVLSELGAI
jgi:hypothetical protein